MIDTSKAGQRVQLKIRLTRTDGHGFVPMGSTGVIKYEINQADFGGPLFNVNFECCGFQLVRLNEIEFI